MAKYNLNLREPKGTNKTAIYLFIRYNNQTPLRFNTGKSITPGNWNPSTQRARETSQFEQHPEFNERLKQILSIAEAVFCKFQNQNDGSAPSKDQLKTLLHIGISDVIVEKKDLFTFIDRYINQPTGKTEKTLQWHRLTLKRLKEFSKVKGVRVDFDTIDLDFYYKFTDYLTVDLDHCMNTVAKHIQNLKAFLNVATAQGVNSNMAYQSDYFKKETEKSDNIALNVKEINEMYALDLSDNPRLERVRDLFVVGCWTGLRFSDFNNIKSENIQGEFIRIRSFKSKEIVVIPIHKQVREIMKKYEGQYPNSLPPSISNAKLNKYIKEVGKLCTKTLHSKVFKSKTKGGLVITVAYLKYELIASHTCRRSFATNLYRAGVPTLTIMAITGHKTEKAFLTYIKIDADEHAEMLRVLWQKQLMVAV